MQKIVPHLWFDREAVEAAEFYTNIFPDSKIISKSVIKDTPSGDCDVVSFSLSGLNFMAISAGPSFKPNPSISFIIGCDTKEEVDSLWEKLSQDGKVLMPLQKYDFSKRYGWIQDKYGVSWQLILTSPDGDERPKIVPSLLFVGNMYGKAEEAVKFYISVFKPAKVGNMMHYGPGQEPNEPGTVMFSDFKLKDTWLAAMDGGGRHDFKFNEAISLIVNCKDQEEIDRYWKALSAVPEAEQCGWLKDKFGVSWQIVPVQLERYMKMNPKNVTQSFLKMKKFDISELKRAAEE